MKFNINYNGSDVELQQLEFTGEENSDLKLALENTAGAAISLMTMFAATMAEDEESRRALLKAVLNCVNTNIDKMTDNTQQAAYFDYPFEDMESEFITWIYGMGYDDPYAFAQEYDGRQLKLDFAVEDEDVVVFFSDNDGNRCDEIGTIATFLFEDEEELAAANCREFTCIAALAFDKLYGHEDNPLRKLPVNTLENRIKETLK